MMIAKVSHGFLWLPNNIFLTKSLHGEKIYHETQKHYYGALSRGTFRNTNNQYIYIADKDG